MKKKTKTKKTRSIRPTKREQLYIKTLKFLDSLEGKEENLSDLGCDHFCEDIKTVVHKYFSKFR